MYIQPQHVFCNDFRKVKMALALYPDVVNLTIERSYPIHNAVGRQYSTNVIKLLLRHGASVNKSGTNLCSYAEWYLPLQNAVVKKKWVWAREIIKHGARVTDSVRQAYTTAPAKERRWFEDWTRHKERMAAVIPELLIRAAYSYGVPPLEVKPGIIIPGRQGYEDSLQRYLLMS